MPVLRQVIGETLRGVRLRQQRTLREVSATARVSLGYLSEVERGQKEPSSELLASICSALGVELSDVFAEVSRSLRREEKLAADRRIARVPAGVAVPGAPSVPAVSPVSTVSPVPLVSTGPTASVHRLPRIAA